MFLLGALLFLVIQVQGSLPFRNPGYEPGSYYDFFNSPTVLPPLAVLAERPFSVARSTINVPLILIARDSLRTIHNAHISAVSPTEPLVTCQTNKYSTVSLTVVIYNAPGLSSH